MGQATSLVAGQLMGALPLGQVFIQALGNWAQVEQGHIV